MTENKKQYPHYFRDVSKYSHIDIYRVLDLWQVTSPPLQHAVKKLLCAGKRGYKDYTKDLEETVVAVQRAIEMVEEDGMHY